MAARPSIGGEQFKDIAQVDRGERFTAERCLLASWPENGLVLDPFGGAGTTALVSRQNWAIFMKGR